MSFSIVKCARALGRPSVRCLSTSAPRPSRSVYRKLALGTIVGVAAGLAFAPNRVYLDSQPQEATVQDNAAEDLLVDPATSIPFPKVMRVPSKVMIPPLTLVGVGVRTVSFLGVKVYSVAFYADLNDPNLKISLEMPPEEKVVHIIRNTSCVIRIVPTRSTSYTHLRDAFMRALQARLSRSIQDGAITEETAQAAASPLRTLKGLFPNSPLAKHTPLDIFLAAPIAGRPRPLVFRDLGSIENDWVATEFVLNYFGPEAPSPALKNSVYSFLKLFKK
ncbi:chalcone-flavanone isomerase-domain-containing protein [Gymnopilus junonius]|uniref:Chalcone-flavanone isomerase-domain-containing protein n=1 Tax=Gymnopilus junonius TaxID=109634 RepID=A0A9P5NIZ9_GYMJU|nr:chalcone-flavanone isomerase-domain-containing protein [Gymnopilus junonius]